MKICLVAGHSSNDTGAVANLTTEHKEVEQIMLSVYTSLTKKGVSVMKLPEQLSLIEQIATINKAGTKNDLIINLHMNASSPSTSGVMAFYYDGSLESKSRAQRLLDALLTELKLPSLGVVPDTSSRFGRLGIIRDTIPWAFLIELGFLTNLADLTIARNLGAIALEKAILSYVKNIEQSLLSMSPLHQNQPQTKQ